MAKINLRDLNLLNIRVCYILSHTILFDGGNNRSTRQARPGNLFCKLLRNYIIIICSARLGNLAGCVTGLRLRNGIPGYATGRPDGIQLIDYDCDTGLRLRSLYTRSITYI